jgi:hypothetical protein
MNKWKSLKREYKAVIDQNAKTGNNNIKKCKFYEKCKNLYGNKPSTRSDFTMDSSTGGKSNTESSFDASTNNGTSNSDKRPEALKSLYRSPGNKKTQLVLCKNYVLQW